MHLLGNIVIWYSATFSIILYSGLLIFYLLRRRRECYDIPEAVFQQYVLYGEIFLCGYLWHYLPYFFVERTLFLHHYLPAFVFKVLLMVALMHHIYYLFKHILKVQLLQYLYISVIVFWTVWVLQVFSKFIVLSYGLKDLSMNDILNLRWKDTWDFIIHRNV